MKRLFFIAVLCGAIILLWNTNIIRFILDKADAMIDNITFKPNAIIDYPVVNLREKPSRNAKNIGSLKQGTKVYVVEQNNGWLKIEYAQGKFAYIFGAYVRFINRQDNKLNGQVGVVSRSYNVFDPNSLKRLFIVKKEERVIVLSSIDADTIEIIAPPGKGVLPSECVKILG